MTVNPSSGHTTIGSTAVGRPTRRHAPGDDCIKRGAHDSGRHVDARIVIAEARETEAVGVATVVSATRQASHGSATCFVNVAELVDREMVADIAPTERIHVIVLRQAHSVFSTIKSCD